ncbi:uncharacterized protein CTRU02_202887 [Colletotrichum truncatum]|uniref:Uncharacterized protein n=1 Tax=Colletotrichum truncatum TaxID=5467 RepID=A0ACC3ZLQ1_COLTU|nr:uncharacterized protein CTRU02_12981 [Colletotrichum truncatum]KAF6783965.1 hypothetical protein CTRU02_12981 [Colletotrichum truncatum]
MVNPNRWSWSGGPRKAYNKEYAVISKQPLISPSVNHDSNETADPADSKLQTSTAGISSRRLSKNRWSWRPDAAIAITVEAGQENDHEDREQSQGQLDRPATSNGLPRNPKHEKQPDATAPSRRLRPLSMIAPASAPFGKAPSFSNLKEQKRQQEDADQLSSDPNPFTAAQSSAGVKDAFNRFIGRQLTRRKTKSGRPLQQFNQQGEAEPTPPPSRHQQQAPSRPMQPPMRRGPQLHNPQNTLRGGPPANPASFAQTQAQGRIETGRMAAPLPELDEQSELQLPLTYTRPSTATSAVTGLGTSSSPPAPSAEETGLLGRFVRRRLVPKDKDTTNNKNRWISTSDDNTSQPAGTNHESSNLSGPTPNFDESTEHEMQSQSILLPASQSSHRKVNGKVKADENKGVSDPGSFPSSSVPRFLRHLAKPQQATTTPVPNPEAVAPHKAKSRSQSQQAGTPQQHQQMPSATSPAPSKLRTKPSFGKRFWSKSSSNHFENDEEAKTEVEPPVPAPVLRPVYVPKHAASDFSRTTSTTQRYRKSVYVGNGEVVGNYLAANSADIAEDEPQSQKQRRRMSFAERADKRMSREVSSSKYEAPSPQELHRRLEIVKSSEIEVVSTREESSVDDSWQQHQHKLLQMNSNVSINGKGSIRSQSRPRSTRRYSFNLVADPFARDLTPPKSVSPVEMEAPYDPPSQTPPDVSQHQVSQQALAQVPKHAKSSHARSNPRPKTQPEEQPRKDTTEMTDYERFVANAQALEREQNAEMWRQLARRSGHYRYNDNVRNSFLPDPVTTNPGVLPYTYKPSKRDSAQFSVGKRASMMSYAADDERNLFYVQPVEKGASDTRRELRHQGSVSRRISEYIKPPKQHRGSGYDEWLAPGGGRANRRSIITGVSEE